MAQTLSDEAVARFVLDHRMATSAQVDEARAAQREAAREGLDLSLAEILVDHGAITAAQRDLLLQRSSGPSPDVPAQILHYRLLRKIGEGGMGSVYLAEDVRTKQSVALKLLARRFADDAEFMLRFQHESDAAGRLHHTSLARAFSAGEDLGYHFYAMEYCPGETLADRLARDGSLPADEATRIVIQIARGLQHAHERHMIHRDIKPSNIRVAPDGTAKILDFGLSKRVGDVELLSGERHGAIGSPHYMSPEQARREPRIDGRADIYSLGVTYYHCVTGDTPFHGRDAAEIVAQHRAKRLPDPRDLREEIPDGVVHVIRRMLAKSPSDRYTDCRALLEDLERVGAEAAPQSEKIADGLSSVALPKITRAPRRQFAPRPRPAPPPAPAPPPPPRIEIERGDEGGGGHIADAADRAIDALLAVTRRGGRRLAVWSGRAARATSRGLSRAFRSLSRRRDDKPPDGDGAAPQAP